MSGRRDSAAAWATIGLALGGAGGMVVWLLGGIEILFAIAIGSAIGTLGGTAAGALVPMLGVGTTAGPGPQVLSEAVQSWRSSLLFRCRSEADGQLQQLRRGIELFDPGTRKIFTAARMKVGGERVSLSQVADRWELSRSRLVILGEPGYGKTMAALRLVTQVDRGRDHPDRPVAAFFRLTDWYRWQGDHAREPLAAWFADQLVEAHAAEGLTVSVAQALVERGLLIPVLDGLDEVPDPHRTACKDAIDLYAGAAAPFRPFVVTCRLAEYAELAPAWVRAEHHIVLSGLDRHDIDELLRSEAGLRSSWEPVRDHLRNARDEDPLVRLFASPLRASVAVQSFRNSDPSLLLGLDLETAKAQLWDSLLTVGGPGFRDTTIDDARRWLTFIAQGMRHDSRQRFWLHELHRYVPNPKRRFRQFRIACGLVVGLVFYGLEELLGARLVPRLVLGLVFGTLVGVVVTNVVISRQVAIRVRLRAFRRGLRWKSVPALVFGLVGVLFGLSLIITTSPSAHSGSASSGSSPRGWVYDLFAVVFCGVFGLEVGALIGGVVNAVEAGRAFVATEPDPQLGNRGPNEIIVRTRNAGLLTWLAFGFVGGLVGLAAKGLRHAQGFGLPVGWLVVGLFVGLLFGLRGGLSGWLYYYWLRRSLAACELLPRQLVQFLAWCDEPTRAWIRVSEAYEFRHRELIDHLCDNRPPPSTITEQSRPEAAPGDRHSGAP